MAPSIPQATVAKTKLQKGYSSKITVELNNIFDQSSALSKGTLSSKDDKRNKLINLIQEYESNFNHIHAVTIIHRCCKHDLDVTEIIPIPKLLQYFSKTNTRKYWSPQEISQAMYGLKGMSINTPHILEYLQYIVKKLESCHLMFSPNEIGSCLYGLQQLSCSIPEVGTIVRLLRDKLRECNTPFEGVSIANALYGLRKMTSHNENVMLLISELTQKLEQSTMSANSVAFALNGLQCFNEEHPAVLNCIQVLTAHLKKSNEALTQQSIGSAFMGLRSLTADSSEVQELLLILARKIKESTDLMTESTLCSAFNGLRNMSDSSVNVQEVISALVQKLEKMPAHARFTSISMANLLYGLRKMTGNNNATKTLLRLITSRMDTEIVWSSEEIGTAFYGLQSLASTTCSEVLPIMQRLTSFIGKLRTPMVLKDISTALYGFRAQSNLTIDVREALQALTSQLSKQRQVYFEPNHVSMAISGLQGFDSTSLEIRRLIAAIVPKLDRFDARACGNSLQGIYRMSTDCLEIIELLDRYAEAINACPDIPSAKELAGAYYGLQNKDSRANVVIDVLKALNDKFTIASPNIQMSAQEISMSLCGLQTMSSDDSPEILRTIELLAGQIESNTEIFAPRQIAYSLFGRFSACSAIC
jgi:hypothetical protein